MNIRSYLRTAKVSQAELARRVGVTPGMVWQWLHARRRIAAEQVIAIEAATEGAVSRHDIRPDLYPRDQVA